MAISRISAATNNGTTVTLGTHAKGDLILYFAIDVTNPIVTPDLPSGVLGLTTRGSSGGTFRVGYYIADSSSETVGTTGWTNAQNVTAIVYRGGPSSIIVPTALSINGTSGTTIGYGAQPALTSPVLKESALDYWVGAYVFSRSTLNNLASLVPSGMSYASNSIMTSVNCEVANYDTNSTRTTAWPTTNVTQTFGVIWATLVFDLLELDHKITGGGGVFDPLTNPFVG